MYKKILVPLDGSSLAEAALTHAEEIAKKEGAEIIVLRVPDQIEFKYPTQAYIESVHAQAEADEDAEKYVHQKVSMLKKEAIKAKGIVRDGPVTETILAVAEETHADLITMSTHGWTGLQHFLKGSIAEKIVQNARIPVTVLHPN